MRFIELVTVAAVLENKVFFRVSSPEGALEPEKSLMISGRRWWLK